jgi:large subunit ribosomal protein L30
MSNMLEITLIKSTIGTTEKQRAVVRGLGLRRLHQTVSLQDSPETLGMINKISHMLKVK